MVQVKSSWLLAFQAVLRKLVKQSNPQSSSINQNQNQNSFISPADREICASQNKQLKQIVHRLVQGNMRDGDGLILHNLLTSD